MSDFLYSILDIPFTVFLVLILLTGLLLIALAFQKRMLRMRGIARGLLISYVVLVVFFLIGEAWFRFTYADSGWAFTRAHRNWEDRYWQTNSQGFRDQEWSPDDWEGKTTVAIIGDSFAAGWGVMDPSDRFGDVLAEQLGDDYAVINLARPGNSTRQALEDLQEHPPKNPDIVIWQYFLNDIEEASVSIGRNWERVPPELPPRLIDESHLFNFLYWRIYPALQDVNVAFERSYWDWEYGSYDNMQIWEIHTRELDAVTDYVDSIGAELIVVIFPNMADPVTSIPYVDRVAQYLESRGYPNIMKLFEDVAQWELADAIVSPRDHHPSAAFHRHVGEKLFDTFFADSDQ